jgi:hypothetical protein
MKIYYAYCHTCDRLLAKCCDENSTTANAVINKHHESHKECTVTVGESFYFEKVFPKIELEF